MSVLFETAFRKGMRCSQRLLRTLFFCICLHQCVSARRDLAAERKRAFRQLAAPNLFSSVDDYERVFGVYRDELFRNKKYSFGWPVEETLVILDPHVPVIFEDNNYYWNRSYYQSSDHSGNDEMCIQRIDDTDTTFKGIVFPSGRRIVEIVFGCPKTSGSTCCYFHCCGIFEAYAVFIVYAVIASICVFLVCVLGYTEIFYEKLRQEFRNGERCGCCCIGKQINNSDGIPPIELTTIIIPRIRVRSEWNQSNSAISEFRNSRNSSISSVSTLDPPPPYQPPPSYSTVVEATKNKCVIAVL